MAERLKAAVLKTVVPSRAPGVRIPLPPPFVAVATVTRYTSQVTSKDKIYEISKEERKVNCFTFRRDSKDGAMSTDR